MVPALKKLSVFKNIVLAFFLNQPFIDFFQNGWGFFKAETIFFKAKFEKLLRKAQLVR